MTIIRIFGCILLLTVHYFEFLWKHLEEPTVFLMIQKCNNDQSLSSFNYIRSFLLEQYEKIFILFSNASSITKKQPKCHIYRINLHFPVICFLFKSLCAFYYAILFFKILVWFYKKQCDYILQKQIKPFVNIRSVALISTNRH